MPVGSPTICHSIQYLQSHLSCSARYPRCANTVRQISRDLLVFGRESVIFHAFSVPHSRPSTGSLGCTADCMSVKSVSFTGSTSAQKIKWFHLAKPILKLFLSKLQVGSTLPPNFHEPCSFSTTYQSISDFSLFLQVFGGARVSGLSGTVHPKFLRHSVSISCFHLNINKEPHTLIVLLPCCYVKWLNILTYFGSL